MGIALLLLRLCVWAMWVPPERGEQNLKSMSAAGLGARVAACGDGAQDSRSVGLYISAVCGS